MRHIIPISGKDSLATAILQTAHQPELIYEYVFNPTGLELPEVLVWLDKVEIYLQQPIIRVGKDLQEIIKGYNYFLPAQNARYCTKEAKIQPFVKFINGEQATVYYGIRADENRVGFDNSLAKNITPNYPLQRFNIDLQGVYSILAAKDLKPPVFYWKELHEKVIKILGFDPKDRLPEWMFDRLFAWRSRANCDRCFNQRKYEWIGLLFFHPALFWDASNMESMGSENYKRSPVEAKEQFLLFSLELLESLTVDSLEGKYTFCADKKPLVELAQKAKNIFNKRAYQVAKAVNVIIEKKLFEDEADKENVDILAVTSCGLMCGK